MFSRTLDYVGQHGSKATHRLVYQRQGDVISVKFYDLTKNIITELHDTPKEYDQDVYRDILFSKVNSLE